MPSVRIIDSKCHGIGLVDGGKTYFECADCGEELAYVWHTMPDENFKIDVKAKCPFCKDGESYVKTISGGFAVGTREGGKTKLRNFLPYENGIQIIEVDKE